MSLSRRLQTKNLGSLGTASPMELANRGCFIVSDGDKVAKEKQREYKGYGTWYRYDELLPSETVVTGEDFIKPEVFLAALAPIRSKHPSLPDLKAEDMAKTPKLACIKAWLDCAKISAEECRTILNDLKDGIFAKVEPAHIEQKYFLMVEQLAVKITGKATP